MNKIDELYTLFTTYNEEQFNGKLTIPRLLVRRTCASDGYFEYRADKDWAPMRRAETFAIVVGEHCWKEDIVEGTLLHEMVHQYQVEIMGRKPSHDAIFKSISRKLGRIYGVDLA